MHAEESAEYKSTHQMLSDPKSLDQVHWDKKRKVRMVTVLVALALLPWLGAWLPWLGYDNFAACHG